MEPTQWLGLADWMRDNQPLQLEQELGRGVQEARRLVLGGDPEYHR